MGWAKNSICEALDPWGLIARPFPIHIPGIALSISAAHARRGTVGASIITDSLVPHSW